MHHLLKQAEKEDVKVKSLEYVSIHSWMRRYYGSANKCEMKGCSGKSKNYSYALLKGKKYERNRKNYWQLCRICHAKYDFTPAMHAQLIRINQSTNKRFCSRGHLLEGRNMVFVIAKKGSFRRCRKCHVILNSQSKKRVRERKRLASLTQEPK